MAGAEEVVAAVGEVGAELSGLVLNERGSDRFAATTLDRVNVTLAATESFNRRNGNASLPEAVERVERILAASARPTTVTLSCSFGCPFEGEVDPGVVLALAEGLVAAGAGEVVLADTIGVATPSRVRTARGADGSARRPGRWSLPRHAAYRRRVRVGGARGRRDGARRVGRRASAAARSRRARPATSRPRTSSTCSSAKASRPASTSTR